MDDLDPDTGGPLHNRRKSALRCVPNMSAENPKKTLPPFVAWFGVPLIGGFVMECACALLQLAVHYFSTSILPDIKRGVWSEVRDPDTWIALAVCILLVAGLMRFLEVWKWAHPSWWVRTGILLAALIATGIVDPIGSAFREDLLAGFDKAQPGQKMKQVLDRIHYASPSLVVPHEDNSNDSLGCVGNCWIRLTYEVPAMFSRRWLDIDFGPDEKMIRKCDTEGACPPANQKNSN